MDEDKGHGYRDGNRYTDVLIIDILIMDTDTTGMDVDMDMKDFVLSCVGGILSSP
jgi:hypothetical protein